MEGHFPLVHVYADDKQLHLSFWPVDDKAQNVVHRAMEECIPNIQNCLIDPRLLLNDDETKFLVIGPCQQLDKLSTFTVQVGLS